MFIKYFVSKWLKILIILNHLNIQFNYKNWIGVLQFRCPLLLFFSLRIFQPSFFFSVSAPSFLFFQRLTFFENVLPFFSPKRSPFCACLPFQFWPLSKPRGTRFSCQLLRSKRNFPLVPFIQDPIFSLAASRLFYLNKSSFSSNLQ